MVSVCGIPQHNEDDDKKDEYQHGKKGSDDLRALAFIVVLIIER